MEQEKLIKQCPYCGEDININAKKCKHCKEWLEDVSEPNPTVVQQPTAVQQPAEVHQPTVILRQEEPRAPQQQVVVNQVEQKSNGVGTAGFVIALISACLSWVPGVNLFFLFVGFILSFIGMFMRPRGLAIAGFLISIIDIIIVVSVLGAVGSLLSTIF